MWKMKPLTLLLTLSLAPPLAAAKYSILIGIGTYTYKGFQKLDGPPEDLKQMRKLLVERMAFPAANVVVLAEAGATHAAIVSAVNDLKVRVRKGDSVFFYYSGHGTSVGDALGHSSGLDPNTGGLVPYDLDPLHGPPVIQQLIVGTRDLGPVFTALDKIATVFAVFDTCFSADAAKAIDPNGTQARYAFIPRGGDLDDYVAEPPAGGDSSPFPYSHLISLSAAGKFQKAGDISLLQVRDHPELTVDGKPHGVMTNAFLKGMQGAADKDRDGKISYEELFAYLQEQSIAWKHKPVMQSSGDLRSTVIEVQTPREEPKKRTVAVKLEFADKSLASRLAALPGIVVDEKLPDLIVRSASPAGRFDLYLASGLAISQDSLTADQLVSRVEAEPAVRDLLDLKFPNPFNIGLRVFPADQGVYFGGDEMRIEAKTAEPAYLLLLDIDIYGAVTVVAPFAESAAPLFNSAEFKQLGGVSKAGSPFGVEFLKLFAFKQKPKGLDDWVVKPNPGHEDPITVTPGSPEFKRLIQLLQSAPPATGETRMSIVTAPKK